MGRPRVLSPTDLIRIHTTGKTKLQEHSERRAVVNALIEMKGVASVEDLNAAMKFNVESTIMSLTRAGWLEVVE